MEKQGKAGQLYSMVLCAPLASVPAYWDPIRTFVETEPRSQTFACASVSK